MIPLSTDLANYSNGGCMRRRIVVLDGHTLNPGDNPWDEIAALGDLEVYDRTAFEDILARSADAHILLTNKTPLPADILQNLPRLEYIGVLATGYNVVDTAAAKARGLPVSNVPEYGTRSVAQFVFALLLELCHRVGIHDRAVKAGEWGSCPDFSFTKSPQAELHGKIMGIIGFGRIGRAVGNLAHAFGMEVQAVEPNRGEEPVYRPFSWTSLEDAFAGSDVISLNCALTTENRGIVNRSLLSLLKPGCFLINAARGDLINETDLAEGLRAGRPAGAAVDVASEEPIRSDNPLLNAPNCIITPHIAWASLEARRRLMRTVFENIRSFLSETPHNVVNP
jgi:glycerate dehydrogenase